METLYTRFRMISYFASSWNLVFESYLKDDVWPRIYGLETIPLENKLMILKLIHLVEQSANIYIKYCFNLNGTTFWMVLFLDVFVWKTEDLQGPINLHVSIFFLQFNWWNYEVAKNIHTYGVLDSLFNHIKCEYFRLRQSISLKS